MRGVLILVSVLAATIPVGFFKPGPLDDITINLNLDESTKEEEEDTDTQVDQGEKISAQERVCGINQLGNCGLKFSGAVAKCIVNPGAIIECVKDVIADDSCIDCIFALIQLAGGNIKCSDTVSGPEEEEDTDAHVAQVREKIMKESKGLMVLGKSRQISAQERSCGLTQIGNCALKFTGAVARCIVNPGAIIECVKDVITDDSCIDCISELIELAGGDVKCSVPLCGVENKQQRKRIIGGKETLPNQYPWMVRLKLRATIALENGTVVVVEDDCGGSLITDRHVLTAKHCLDGSFLPADLLKINWKESKALISVHDQLDPRDYKEVSIKKPMWPRYNNHDIAMLILRTPVNLNDKTIGTVCLPSSANKDYTGETAMAMGWGMTHHQSDQSRVLQHVKLTVSQTREKNWLYTEVPLVNGVPQDACAGDSGGPLVHQDVTTGRWTIIATVQGEGYDCRGDTTNGEGRWNKVTDHLDWIYEQIGQL